MTFLVTVLAIAGIAGIVSVISRWSLGRCDCLWCSHPEYDGDVPRFVRGRW